MEMLKHIVDGYRMLEVFVVDGRKVADVISELASIADLLEDEIVGEKESDEIVVEKEDELMPNEAVGEEDVEIEVEAEDDVEEDDEIEVEAEDDVEWDDESGEDDNYVPYHTEEETDDEMEACELVPDDEEYIQARKKNKDDKVVEITDEMFLSINNADKGINWGDSDYELSDDDGLSDTSHLEGTKMKDRHRIITYDPKCDHKSLKLTVGMSFTDGYEAKAAITNNAIENGWEIHFKRANRQHVEAYCKPPCTWKCFGSLVKKTGQFLMKSVKDEHTCPRAMKNSILSSNWIARKYLNVFRARPDLTTKELGRDLMQRYACDATRWRLYHAKNKAIELLRGSVEEHYGKLRRYCLELGKVDKEGRFELQCDIGSVFKSVYIGFSGLELSI